MATLNVQGGLSEKKGAITRWMTRHRVAVCIICELRLAKGDVDLLVGGWPKGWGVATSTLMDSPNSEGRSCHRRERRCSEILGGNPCLVAHPPGRICCGAEGVE